MRHPANIGRLSILAAELGIGAALACTPAVASADTSTQLTPTELAEIDQVLRWLFDPTGADMQVSINGMDLFPTEGNTAIATSGNLDIAIAVGNGANAIASGNNLFGISLGSGIFDVSFANGTNSTADAAVVGPANFDFVFASGDNSVANAGLGANYDIASAVGTGSHAQVGVGASFDTASANGTNSYADVGVGNNDLALANGTDSSATAGVGDSDLAAAFGGGNAAANGFFTTAFANGTNTVANADGILDSAGVSGTDAEAQAVNGLGDSASVFNTGSAFDQAFAGGTSPSFPGDSFDTAVVIGTGSTAFAGSDLTEPGQFDLAAAFGDMLNAIATGSNFVIDIPPLPPL
jgi:hypothetical protein